MFTDAYEIGIHSKDIRRTTDVLQNDRSEPLEYDYYKQDDGFYLFSFPEIDENEFKSIVLLLKNNGINAIGADTELEKAYELSENKIMRLIKENQERPNPMESADDIIAKLEEILETWETKEYESDEKRWNEYYLDIEDLVTDYKENQSIDRPDTDIQTEQKLRKLITKIIQE